jgi:hypothetical protein
VTRDRADLALLVVLAADAAVLGAFGLVFTPLYMGATPVPLGVLFSLLVLPWLVLRAGEVDPRPGVAAVPILAWLLTVGVLGFAGPARDVLLPATWQSLALVTAGLGGGLWALREVVEGGGGSGVRSDQ